VLPAVPPKLVILRIRSGLTLFVLTTISLPHNAGIAVRTTLQFALRFTRTAQEGTSTDFGRVHLSARLRRVAHLWRLPSAYFPLSQPLFDERNYLQKRRGVKGQADCAMIYRG
jgi:hypothetical protein